MLYLTERSIVYSVIKIGIVLKRCYIYFFVVVVAVVSLVLFIIECCREENSKSDLNFQLLLYTTEAFEILRFFPFKYSAFFIMPIILCF